MAALELVRASPPALPCTGAHSPPGSSSHENSPFPARGCHGDRRHRIPHPCLGGTAARIACCTRRHGGKPGPYPGRGQGRGTRRDAPGSSGMYAGWDAQGSPRQGRGVGTEIPTNPHPIPARAVPRCRERGRLAQQSTHTDAGCKSSTDPMPRGQRAGRRRLQARC